MQLSQVAMTIKGLKNDYRLHYSFYCNWVSSGYALQDKIALGSILVISILWAFAMGPWAIATFIELLIGYAVAKKMLNT